MRLITIGNVTINADLACGVEFEGLDAKVYFVHETGMPIPRPVKIKLELLDGEAKKSARDHWIPMCQSLGGDRAAKLTVYNEIQLDEQRHREAVWRAQDRFRDLLFKKD